MGEHVLLKFFFEFVLFYGSCFLGFLDTFCFGITSPTPWEATAELRGRIFRKNHRCWCGKSECLDPRLTKLFYPYLLLFISIILFGYVDEVIYIYYTCNMEMRLMIAHTHTPHVYLACLETHGTAVLHGKIQVIEMKLTGATKVTKVTNNAGAAQNRPPVSTWQIGHNNLVAPVMQPYHG